ncbi:hypothetical protein ACSFA0_25310 [Variovorax sp. LT1P1]|uniref:hypothetical protein n=1 Tax=Variovorax sp. LT1P1 TaxID=3443730 RepID=UPI003F485536
MSNRNLPRLVAIWLVLGSAPTVAADRLLPRHDAGRVAVESVKQDGAAVVVQVFNGSSQVITAGEIRCETSLPAAASALPAPASSSAVEKGLRDVDLEAFRNPTSYDWRSNFQAAKPSAPLVISLDGRRIGPGGRAEAYVEAASTVGDCQLHGLRGRAKKLFEIL